MNFLILLTIIATWDFANDANIQEVLEQEQSGKTFTLSSDVDNISMYVDASQGVFEPNYDKGQANAPINSVHIDSRTTMYVPIYRIGDLVTITTTDAESAGDNPAGTAYKPNTVTITGTTTTYTAISADVQASTLAIIATTDTYVQSVVVEYADQQQPLLLAFTFNNEEFTASEVFNYDDTDQTYYGTIAITKDTNLSPTENNLPQNLQVQDGQVQSIIFNEDEEGYGTVTITITDDEDPANTTTYILAFEGKPDYTIYYYVDEDVFETQSVEQDATITILPTTVAHDDGVFRGWFYDSGLKATVDDLITQDTNLYALINEAEEATGDSSWDYDLTNPYFYPEDHELIDITGSYDNTTHGWTVEQLTVEVSSNAFIILGMCSSTTGTITITIDDVVAEQINATFQDAESYTYHYQGSESALVTFTLTGNLHYVHLRNIAEKDIEQTTQNGEDFYWVNPIDGDSDQVNTERAELLIEIIEVINSLTNDGSRVVVFLPNGTYDLGTNCLPTITRNNVSIVGQSIDNTIIKNNINFTTSKENALLPNNSTGLYLQDLTLQNDYPYYETSSDRRGVCLLDKGKNTICKNVRMLSYQNTFYTYNDNNTYLDACDLHGTLDFIIGSGNVYFDQCNIYVEGRKQAGIGSTSEAIITSPNTAQSCLFGYVFNNCYVTGVEQQTYSFGRAWSNTARCVWINTQLDQNLNLTADRWYLSGTSTTIVPYLFAEYATTPATTQTTATFNGTLKTIVLAEDAETDEYTVDYYNYQNIFTDSDPALETQQVELSQLCYEVGSNDISFTTTTDALTYAVFLNGIFCGFTENTPYTLSSAITQDDIVEIRGANYNGGLGNPITKAQQDDTEALTHLTSDPSLIAIEYYDLAGRKLVAPQHGLNIKVLRYSNGTHITQKINY